LGGIFNGGDAEPQNFTALQLFLCCTIYFSPLIFNGKGNKSIK